MDYINRLLTYTLNDIRNVMMFLPAGMITFLGIGLFWLTVLRHKAGYNNWKKFLTIPLTISYLVILLFITLLSRESGGRGDLILQPFVSLGHGARRDAYVLENILLFVPLGMLLPLAGHTWRHFLSCAGTGMLLSIFVETSQFFLKLGYAQTDDVLANTLGTIIGFWIYLFFRSLKRR